MCCAAVEVGAGDRVGVVNRLVNAMRYEVRVGQEEDVEAARNEKKTERDERAATQDTRQESKRTEVPRAARDGIQSSSDA
jgi:hypothetical protein